MADDAGLLTWLQSLQGGAATAVGAMTGSVIGFGALVAGALFNAKLNRDRDDRLRSLETRSVAAALRGELRSVETTLRENAKVSGRIHHKTLSSLTYLIRSGCFPIWRKN